MCVNIIQKAGRADAGHWGFRLVGPRGGSRNRLGSEKVLSWVGVVVLAGAPPPAAAPLEGAREAQPALTSLQAGRQKGREKYIWRSV